MSNEITKKNDFAIPEGYICTIDTSTVEGQIEAVSAFNGASSLSECGDEVLAVKGFITTKGVRSRTGEVCTNTYLVLQDGTALFTQSDGIARSVPVIVAAFTRDDVFQIPEGYGMQVKSTQLNNGNTLKTLVPAKLENNA